MLGRQKILLWFLQNGDFVASGPNKLMKLLFLTKMETSIGTMLPFYDFLPYMYGPFSHIIANDVARLKEHGKNDEAMDDMSLEIVRAVGEIDRKYRRQSLEQIISYVYTMYPQFAEKSVNRSKYIQGDTGVPKTKLSDTPLNTIHYENRSVDAFLHTLICQKIDILVDVRRDPVSMKYGFRRRSLEQYAAMHTFEYLHLPELGVDRSERKKLQIPSDYAALFRRYRTITLGTQGPVLNRISTLIGSGKRIALLCFEKDPSLCHRSCVAEALSSRLDLSVAHL
jgi:uncharacterized protein (DUF488 family)